MDSSYTSVSPSPNQLGNFASNLSRVQIYAPGTPAAAAATTNYNRQPFLSNTLLAPCSSLSGESPTPSITSAGRSSPAPSVVSMGTEKQTPTPHDRKVPVPIGTERSARIRQTGTSTPSTIGSNLATPVGHSGIWSFEGMGGGQGMEQCRKNDKVSSWCHTGVGNHMVHRPMSDSSVFSQHQTMERECSGIVTPNTFQQHVPAGYIDFAKVGGMPFSVYGNAVVPPVAQMTDGAVGAVFNGPHAADPSWNSVIKMVSNSTENNCPQTVWTGTWAPHMNGVHMNQLG